MLGASWPIWGAFLRHLAEKAAKQKTLKNLRFFYVFWDVAGVKNEENAIKNR